MHRLPIRWKIATWYAVLLGTALVMVGMMLYFGLRAQLLENLDDQVEGQRDFIARAVRSFEGRPVLDINQLEGADDDQFVRLWTLGGELVTDTGQSLGVPLPGADLIAGAGQGQTLWTTQEAVGETFRIVTTPVRDAGPTVGILQVGVSRGDIDETLSILLVLFVIAAPLVLGIASWGGYLLAGRALAPVVAITGMAEHLSGSDLDARLDLDLPNDELGRLARTFDAMLGRISDAFERQRRFTGDAAHELRTPLALLRSQVDLALARPRSVDEYRQALQGFDRDLVRLNGLVVALLDLARSDTRQLTIHHESFDLAQTIALVVAQYVDRAREAGVELTSNLESAPLCADEDLCIQLLVNLIDNALTHTPAGGSIQVKNRSTVDGAVVVVADTGSGIATDHLDKVFDRFYRVEQGRSHARGGTGLGLSICQAIVGAHGGTISLTSEIGRGTQVEVHLPAGT